MGVAIGAGAGDGVVGEPLGGDGGALEVVEALGLGADRLRRGGVTGRGVQRGERDARVGVVDDEVGRGGDLDRLGRERDPAGDVAARREHLGACAAPRDRGLEVLAGELLARGGHGLGVVDAPSATSACASSAAAWPASMPTPISMSPSYAARSGPIAAAGSPAISSTMPVRYAVSSSPWRRPSSSSVARDDASIERDTSNRPRSASSTAWHRIDVASTDGDAVVMRRRRTTSRQRPPARATGLGPNSAAWGAAPRTAVTRRRSSTARAAPSARSSSTSASPTRPEAREQPGPHLVGLGLAGPVAELLQHLRRAGRERLGAHEPVGIGEPDELGLEALGPGAERGIVAGLGAQFLHERSRRRDVARREHALARDQQQVGTRGGVGLGEQRERAARERAGRGEVVAAERAIGGASTAARRRGARARSRGRRRSRARCGSGRPARSGTRSTASCSPMRFAAAASVHTATRSCSSARVVLSSRRYAASRMSTWWKRCTGSSPQ